MSFNTRIFAINCFKDIANKSLGRNGIIPDAVRRVYDDIARAAKEITGTDDKSKQERAEKNGMAKEDGREEQDER